MHPNLQTTAILFFSIVVTINLYVLGKILDLGSPINQEITIEENINL
jgi:hypothetical protein